MTSEPDSKPGRRPPTIELTAREVSQSGTSPGAGGATDGTASANEQGASKPAAGLWRSYAIGALAGAVAMAVAGSGLWYAGLAPTREAAAPPGAVAPIERAPSAALPADIAARLDKIERTLKAAAQPERALDERLKAADAQANSLGDSVSALRRRVEDVAAAAQTAQRTADEASSAADSAKSGAQSAVRRADLDALAKRIATLETAVNSLAEQVAQQTSAADDRAVRLTIVAEALRAMAERGVSFQSELKALKSLGADQNAIAALEPFAASGIPSAPTLAGELAAIIPALRQASDTTPADATFLAKLEAHAQKLVRITPVDAPVGNDPAAVIARINADAGRIDIVAAIHDIAALPDSAKTLVGAWVKKAEARNAAMAASRQIAADALAALGKTASQ